MRETGDQEDTEFPVYTHPMQAACPGARTVRGTAAEVTSILAVMRSVLPTDPTQMQET